MKRFSFIIVLSALSTYTIIQGKQTQGANIIFDLGGVLLQPSPLAVAREVGFTKFVGGFNPLEIPYTFYNYMEHIKPRLETTPLIYQNNKFLLPQIMCDWLDGSLTADELLLLVDNYLIKIAPSIDSKRKLKLIRALADCMFDPQKFSKTIKPIKKGKKLFKQCAYQTNNHGIRINKIFICSNWDERSYYLMKNNPQLTFIFSLAHGSVISGIAHKLKPDPEFFEYAFRQFGIDPDKELTIYIDDQLCNIKGAESLHKKQLHCILCKNKNFGRVKRHLKKLGAIS